MSSNYNRIPRPPVVFVKNGQARLVVKRESYEDLIRNDYLLTAEEDVNEHNRSKVWRNIG